MALMSPKVWIALAFAGLLAIIGLQQVRVSNARASEAAARASLAADRATYAQAAQVAEQAARAEESRREAEKQEVINAARKQTQVAMAAARTADAAAVGLRDQLARYVAAIRGTTKDSGTPSGSPSKSDSDPIELLAKLYSESDSRAAEVGLFADRLRIAAQACERSYDRLQPAPGPAAAEAEK
ncbi:DUF2514 family protein [Variovorax sp. RT4R15]|uniref:DUF2514 family protein n=1 Tax=Variovorax sp. RT4R15 TaxID=3443737 RepID=UPI003F48BBA0